MVSAVALDSSFLFSVNELKIDVFQKIKESLGKVEFLVPKKVMEEVRKASLLKGKKGVSARIAIELIKKNNARVLKEKEVSADKALEKLSRKGILVATNDRALKKRIKEKNGRVIFIKQKKFVEIE
jgi:rRNA-processing protein FCF1